MLTAVEEKPPTAVATQGASGRARTANNSYDTMMPGCGRRLCEIFCPNVFVVGTPAAGAAAGEATVAAARVVSNGSK